MVFKLLNLGPEVPLTILWYYLRKQISLVSHPLLFVCFDRAVVLGARVSHDARQCTTGRPTCAYPNIVPKNRIVSQGFNDIIPSRDTLFR